MKPTLEAFGHEWPLIVTRVLRVEATAYLAPDPSVSVEEQQADCERALRVVLPENSTIQFQLVDDQRLSPMDQAEYDRLAEEAEAEFKGVPV